MNELGLEKKKLSALYLVFLKREILYGLLLLAGRAYLDDGV
jgi:hypothetical protein